MTLRSVTPKSPRSYRALLVLVLGVALAACGTAEEDDDALVGKLVVSPELTLQVVNAIYVPVAELNRPGWVVIYEDAGGVRGPALGQTFIDQPINLNVDVELARGITDGETLHAVLHVDRGTEQVFEPDQDDIVEDENGELDRTFMVFVDVDAITPTLVVEDQSFHPIDDDLDEVEIDEAAVRESAWVVVYADAGFTSVLGQASLRPGISRSVDVQLSRDIDDGETLFARLHVEGDNAATFDTAVDPPMLADGMELTGSFVVTLEDVEILPELQVDDQTAAPANHVIVQRAVSRGAGFVVIYADDGAGGLGEVLGQVALSNGENTGVDVVLSRDAVDQERLVGRLHDDLGTAGSFEPGTDTPMLRDGGEVVDDFVVTVDANLMPAVSVDGIAPLDTLSTVVVVPSASSVGPGWLVIHDDAGGTPGAILGHAPLDAGSQSNITVLLERPVADGETLYAMLHADAGSVGSFEPGTDAPVSDAGGSVIAPSFTAAVPAGTAAVRITITATSASDYEINDVFPPTVPSPLPGGGGIDPALAFTAGWRYELVNDVTGGHPFELVLAGATAAEDIVQLSQVATGALEADVDIAWLEDGNTMRFTAAASLAVDTYRCQIHPGAMRGSVSVQ